MNASRNPSRPQPTSSGPNPKVIIGVVVGVLVLVVGAVVFAVSSGDDESDVATDGDTTESEYGIVTVTGDPLPTLEDPSADAAAGQPAPSAISERPSGTTEIEPGEEPMLLVFLAHWCPHCQAELPVLVDLQDEGALDDIRTVAVLTSTTDSRPNYPPTEWLDDEGWTGERFYDDEASTLGQAYGLASFPMMVFVDADGNVVGRLSGEQPAETVEAAIDATVQ